MKKILALLLFVGATALYAQQKTHTVQPKETIYGISKQYGISQEELYKANPKIEKNGIHPGDLIILPTKGSEIKSQETKKIIISDEGPTHLTEFDDPNFNYITIQPKETVYNLFILLKFTNFLSLQTAVSDDFKRSGFGLIIKILSVS